MIGFIYFLQSEKSGRYYIGSSENPIRRLSEFHNLGIVKATRYSTPWKIVFTQEYENMTIARKIERKIKNMKSKVIIEKIIKNKVCKIKIN